VSERRNTGGSCDRNKLRPKTSGGPSRKSLKNHCRANPAGAIFSDMLIGYARVSTDEQTAPLQFDALTQAGCERTFLEHASRASTERPILAEALSHTRSGDTLVVWRLDRLGRSLPHLIQIVQRLEAEGVGLRSLTEGIDTTTAGGWLIFHLFGALADFERELTRERILAGLAAARAQGRIGGRPRKLSAEKLKAAQRLLQDPDSTVSGVARTLGVHRSTVHRVLQKLDAKKIDAEVERGLVQAG
jgi:DNA invertase Pin-like site-specific DNA recombinase